ncbi:uncharacterized protein LOC129800102 isoform X2 [Phlebotomus papatasi]|uniref:uncharacterized protein LOC129800102 isoform X2 n=1 Tax=Phlebotomus papatasi TaxID=29031 RepID=UPI00248389D1|nr:uncharacterized protein LOC129800102 isoform X2 [Phlebotomus papatasi]
MASNGQIYPHRIHHHLQHHSYVCLQQFRRQEISTSSERMFSREQLRHNFVGRHKTGGDSDKNATLCASCLPECSHVTYNIATESNELPEEDRALITLDVHFRYATMVKYRTYVVYEFLDLIVAFGGIAGLFLGSSLLSIVEFVYYALCGIFRGKNVPS